MKNAFPFARHVMKLVGSRRSALERAHGRLVLLGAFFALAFILIAARLVDLTVIQGDAFRRDGGVEIGATLAESVDPLPRANIVDRNGVLLATSLETPSLFVDPALVRDPAALAAALVRALPDVSYGDMLQRLQRKGRFVWLSRNLTPAEQYAVLEIGSPALGFKTEYRRIYPQGDLAPHIVGYTDVDGRGLAGVERSFDNLLAVGEKNLELTLDVRVQHILRRELSAAARTFSATGGAGVVLDIETGELLAAVSWPDFDPHFPGTADRTALFNRLTLGVYELGSTFKIFSTAALLDTQRGSLGRQFDARAPLQVGRFTIADYHPEKRMLTVPEVFMVSSNIGAALMGEAVGTERLKAFYSDLGLFSPARLEIGEVGAPLIPSPWRDINTLTASYGHGIAVSPLQMVAAASSIVGGGTLVRPRLILGRGAEVCDPAPCAKTAVRVVSPETAHRMRQLLRLVVAQGTGKHADVPGYMVGGKTGTAEQPAAGGYSRRHLISSFVGFFPMDAPRYAVFIMLDGPHGTKESFGYATGGWVAAPAVGKVIAAMGALLGIAPENPARGDMAESLSQYVHVEGESGVHASE